MGPAEWTHTRALTTQQALLCTSSPSEKYSPLSASASIIIGRAVGWTLVPALSACSSGDVPVCCSIAACLNGRAPEQYVELNAALVYGGMRIAIARLPMYCRCTTYPRHYADAHFFGVLHAIRASLLLENRIAESSTPSNDRTHSLRWPCESGVHFFLEYKFMV